MVETTTLKPDDAYKAWLGYKKLSHTVSAKFSSDHVITTNLSKKSSITAALERYKKNQRILKSSWVMLDAKTLKNKASGAKRKASVHSGKQQMTTQIKVTRRTVTLQKLEKKELQRYTYEEVVVKGETHYLNCSSEEKDVKLKVMGTWKPLTGAVDLYHYEEGDMPSKHEFVKSYLVWYVDDKGDPTAPKATK